MKISYPFVIYPVFFQCTCLSTLKTFSSFIKKRSPVNDQIICPFFRTIPLSVNYYYCYHRSGWSRSRQIALIFIWDLKKRRTKSLSLCNFILDFPWNMITITSWNEGRRIYCRRTTRNFSTKKTPKWSDGSKFVLYVFVQINPSAKE